MENNYRVTNNFLSFLVSLYGAVFSTSGGEIGIFVQCTMGDFNPQKKFAPQDEYFYWNRYPKNFGIFQYFTVLRLFSVKNQWNCLIKLK